MKQPDCYWELAGYHLFRWLLTAVQNLIFAFKFNLLAVFKKLIWVGWLGPSTFCWLVNQLLYSFFLKVELAGLILGRGVGSDREAAKLLVLCLLCFLVLPFLKSCISAFVATLNCSFASGSALNFMQMESQLRIAVVTNQTTVRFRGD